MRRGAKVFLIALAIALGVLSAVAKSASPYDLCNRNDARLREEERCGDHGDEPSRQTDRGNNNLYVVFKKFEAGDPTDVQSVSMEFALLVGRLQETLVKAQLTRVGAGCYHGTVDLGRQYYKPASYYAFIRYIDPSRIKRRTRFLLTVD